MFWKSGNVVVVKIKIIMQTTATELLFAHNSDGTLQ